MKTTLNIRDDVIRRAKAGAALDGKTLSRFVEDALARILDEDQPSTQSWTDWAGSLPAVSRKATTELNDLFSDPEFRSVDPEMWR